MPKVSVVIPNYNHARYLPQRVRSVLDQTLGNLEVILMDDASTDESRSVMETYRADPRVRLVYNEKNSGSAFKQWNKGVGLARGEWVWIAESDDFAAPGFLARMAALLEKHPEVGLAYCRSELVDADGKPIGQRLPGGSPRWERDFVRHGRDECAEQLALCNTVPNASAVLFRRSVYLQAGGADESFRLMGDWLAWAAMMLHGDVAYVAEPLSFFRTHQKTVRASFERSKEHLSEHRRMVAALSARPGAPGRSFWFGYHTERTYILLCDRRYGRALKEALLAVLTSPQRPYGWRLLLWSLMGPWGKRWFGLRN